MSAAIKTDAPLPDCVTKGPLKPRNLAVWKIVAAQPQGVHLIAILDTLVPKATVQQLSSAMKSLSMQGYLRYQGSTRWGLWHITDRPPLGEQLPQWKLEALYGESRERHAGATAVEGVPAGVPNSVFALAESRAAWPNTVGYGVDIDAAHAPKVGEGCSAAPARANRAKRAGTASPLQPVQRRRVHD